MSGSDEEIDKMAYIRGSGSEFHKIYFPKDLMKFIEYMAEDMEMSFPDVVRLVLRDSMEKFKLFAQLEEGDHLVFDFQGEPEIIRLEDYEDYHEDTFKDVT